MKVYNRLVRDNIPDLILKDHALPTTRVLNDEEYISELNRKLNDEVSKYLETNNDEEMVDILEVIRAIVEFNGSSFEELEAKRKKKADKKGTFKDKVFLEKVIETGD